jgi:hypothetical protein
VANHCHPGGDADTPVAVNQPCGSAGAGHRGPNAHACALGPFPLLTSLSAPARPGRSVTPRRLLKISCQSGNRPGHSHGWRDHPCGMSARPGSPTCNP